MYKHDLHDLSCSTKCLCLPTVIARQLVGSWWWSLATLNRVFSAVVHAHWRSTLTFLFSFFQVDPPRRLDRKRFWSCLMIGLFILELLMLVWKLGIFKLLFKVLLGYWALECLNGVSDMLTSDSSQRIRFDQTALRMGSREWHSRDVSVRRC